ncbi:ABC transporter substrate-binding protein [Virgibacillus sp. FSP13]
MGQLKKMGITGVLMILCMIILSACQESDTSGEVEEPTSMDSEKVSGDITVWAWALEADYLKSIVPEFNEKYPNINVEINKQGPDQVFQRLVSGLASGQESQLPDLVQIQDTDLPSFTEKFPGSFTNLSEMGFSEYEGEFAPAKEKMIKDNKGNYIAFPRDLGPVGVFYRKDIFEKAGVDAKSIETWDDYIDAGETIKEKTGTSMLGLALNGHIPLIRFMIHQQDSFYFDDEGNLNVGSDETLRAAEKLKEIVDSGISQNVTNADGQAAAMKNGTVATIPNSVWYSGTMMDQAPELSGKWGTFPLPKFEEAGGRAANSGGSSFTIPKGSDNKSAAYLFGEFISTNTENQINALGNQGLFPSLTKAYDSSKFSEGVDYFGGDKFHKKFADIAVEIPEVTYTGDYPEVNDIFNEEMASMLLNDEKPEKVIKRLVSRVESSIGEKDIN